MSRIGSLINEYNELGISQQIDYDKFYLYSIVTHSTAIEGSTVSELENQLFFDDDISPSKPVAEQLMNLDLKKAYDRAFEIADKHEDITPEVLCALSGIVMKNTGSLYDTIAGRFDSAKGELRLVNVSAGRGGKSYIAWQKVPTRLSEFCDWLNEVRGEFVRGCVSAVGVERGSAARGSAGFGVERLYEISWEAHYRLVQIHPWVDGNGRMARLVMNMIQREAGLVPSIVKKERRAEYITSLAESQAAENMGPFMEFMLRHHEANIQEQIDEYKGSIEGSKVKEIERWSYGKLSAKERLVLNEIEADPNVTIEAIVVRNGISRPTVTRAISVLKDQGVIERVGSKKTGSWRVMK